MAEADHGYDNFKGVMLCERPVDNSAGGKYSAGSKAGMASLSEPFKSAVAETHELGLPPTGESRSKISSLVARNRRIRRYTQNNALTKHRRWLSRLGINVKVAKASDEMNQIEAEERKRKFKNFTTTLRKKILEGSPLDNIGWASLTRGQAGLALTRDPTPAPEADDVVEDAPEVTEQKKLTQTISKKDKIEVDMQMSAFLDEAVQDALEREKEYEEQEKAEAAAAALAEKKVDVEDAAQDALRREESKQVGSSKSKKLPAWALSEKQAQAREEDEEDDLMSFVSNLDYDSYMDDFDKAEEDAIDDIVKKVDEESIEDEAKWKKSFVTAVNEAVNEELLERNMQDGEDDDLKAEADRQSVGTGVTRTSRRSRMSRMKGIAEDGEDKWDSSTVVGSNDKENVGRKMDMAADVLEEQPHLKQMHTAQSIKTILESVKEESAAA